MQIKNEVQYRCFNVYTGKVELVYISSYGLRRLWDIWHKRIDDYPRVA